MSIAATQLDAALLLLNHACQPIEALWRNANTAPGYRVADAGHAIVVDVRNERATYFFTKQGTAVHPGVVRRTFVITDEGVSIRTDDWAFGFGSN